MGNVNIVWEPWIALFGLSDNTLLYPDISGLSIAVALAAAVRQALDHVLVRSLPRVHCLVILHFI